MAAQLTCVFEDLAPIADAPSNTWLQGECYLLGGAIHRLKEKALEIEIRVSLGIDANLWKNQLQSSPEVSTSEALAWGLTQIQSMPGGGSFVRSFRLRH